VTSCRHCGEEIVPCPTPTLICEGWRHVRYLHFGPVGSHYCGGRSINPVAKPEAAADRRALLDGIMDAELPRYAEALERLGES
jgi:hypothetical protein